MRKPLMALSLVCGLGLGCSQIAGTLAASPGSSKGPQPYSGNTSSTASTTSAPNRANSVSGAQIVQTALKYLGYPYTTTGNSPSTGFSCIGFVSFVYRSNGIPLPGDLGNALAYAPQVPFSSLQPGDILFFQNTVWSGLSHAAIYIGGGRFVHAEWYNRGVVISSFNNDKVDGNYWIGKYLGANRPWAGASVSPVVGSTGGPPVSANIGPAQVSPQKIVSGGQQAVVTVPSLNVRAAPSKSAGVARIVPQGTNLVILGKSKGWYKVQLPDGSIGWVVGAGIGMGTPLATPKQQVANPTVGAQTAPVRAGATKVQKRHPVTSATVGSLRVHTAPALTASVVATVAAGQKMQVLARRNGWVKVRLADGTVGWVKASLTSGTHASSSPPKPASSTAPAKVAVRAQTRVRARQASRSRAAYRSVLTAGVRLHAGPALKARVVGLGASGSRVRVLGYRGAWALVQLPGGLTGYVYSSYVRR